MAQKKRPNDRWFELTPNTIWEEHETPQDDTYVPKHGVLGWSMQVVLNPPNINWYLLLKWAQWTRKHGPH